MTSSKTDSQLTYSSNPSLDPPAYDSSLNSDLINESSPLLPTTNPSPSTGSSNHHPQIQSFRFEPRPSNAASPSIFFRLFCVFALQLALLFGLIIGLAITYPNVFKFNLTFFSHQAGFDLPITYCLVALLCLHLSLVALNPSSSSHFPTQSARHTLVFLQFSIILQITLILLNEDLRHRESSLTIISGFLLLCFLDLAFSSINFVHRSQTSSSPHSSELVIHLPPGRALYISSTRSSLTFQSFLPLDLRISSVRKSFSRTFKHIRLYSYILFILFNTLLLTSNVLLKLSVSPNPQLHQVQIPLSSLNSHPVSGNEVVETRLQLSCQWLNQPLNLIQSSSSHHQRLPITTQTILLFSPSGYTSHQSSQWIQSMSLPDSGFISTRLCQFDRPGYNQSFNLPLGRISDSVKILEKVLDQTGEFDLLRRYWKGIGASGFVLVGHGYGAWVTCLSSSPPLILLCILTYIPLHCTCFVLLSIFFFWRGSRMEAKIFASRHPRLIKSVLYIEPDTEETFFDLDSDPHELWAALSGALSSSWVSSIPLLFPLFFLASPSLYIKSLADLKSGG